MPIMTAIGDLSDITPIVRGKRRVCGEGAANEAVQAVESEWHDGVDEQHL